MTDAPIQILLVEDNTADAVLLKTELARSPLGSFSVAHVNRLEEALARLRQRRFDAVLLDLGLPDSQGIATLRRMNSQKPDNVPIVVLTGLVDESMGVQALQEGAQDYLIKGGSPGHMTTRAIRYAIERTRVEQDLVRSARQQERVAALWRTSLEGGDIKALFAEAVRHVGDELSAEHVEICAVGPGEDGVELRAGAGWLREACGVTDLIGCLGGAQVAFTVVAGEPVVVPDLAREKRFRVPPPLVECGAASSLSVVVRGQPHAAGVLAAYTRRPREFSQSDVTFARAVADVLAAAMRDEAADRALREGAERIRAVLETVIEGIVTIDEHGTIESINPAACRLFGYERDEVVGRNVKILMPEPYQGEHDDYLRNYLRTGNAKIIGIGREVSGLRKDRTVFPLQLGVSEFHVRGRRMFAGVLRDITEQRRLEREVLEIGAQEQRRIGQDLHDGLCQELTGITFALEVLGQKLANRAAPETPSIRKVGELVDQTISHARALAHGLQPVTLDAAGLAAALRELAAKVENMFRVSCLFVSESEVLVHDNVVATHVFRIAQEAISNAVKHGKAKTIVLDLASSDGWLRLTISDDGIGLGKASGGGKGIGMQTMVYRARVVGGRLDVRPGERGGTVVVCAIPLRGGPEEGGTIEKFDTNVDKSQANRQQPQQQQPASTATRRPRAGSARGGGGGRTGQGRAQAKGLPRRRPSDGA